MEFNDKKSDEYKPVDTACQNKSTRARLMITIYGIVFGATSLERP
jgi:hypothetical protein